jgi:hypothetical protein
MPCTGTEEECRRRCIINPESCGGPPPAFASQQSALAVEISVAAVENGIPSLADHQYRYLAAHLLKHFKFAAKS